MVFTFVMLANFNKNGKMPDEIKGSPKNSIAKTRNAILRIKNCSPKFRNILRQRCQERIQNERMKILNSHRKIPIQESFKTAFRGIIREEWENIEDDVEFCKICLSDSTSQNSNIKFNLDEELFLEELLEKELLREEEEWLFQQYKDFLNDEFDDPNSVVCPLCCSGFLKSTISAHLNKIECSKCLQTFSIDKSMVDLQSAIYECLSWHNAQCSESPGFVNILKNEEENNLCIVCDHCSFINVLA